MASCKVSTRDEFYMDLNLIHRRLYVSDRYRLVNTPPQKRLYTSCGCFIRRCFFSSRSCKDCELSYNILDL